MSQAGLKDSNVIYDVKYVTIRRQVYMVIATDAGMQVLYPFNFCTSAPS